MPDFTQVSKEQALGIGLVKEKQGKLLWLCEDDGDIGDFSNERLKKACKEKEFGFFENEYVKFLARIEGLGTGFCLEGSSSLDGGIDLQAIREISETIQEMSEDSKNCMMENLKIFRVFWNL